MQTSKFFNVSDEMKVLKFGAVWCPGCLVMRPRWEEIEGENPWLETEYYDFDDEAEKMAEYGIGQDGLPTFVFLDVSGQELERLSGEISKEKLLEVIERNRNF
ncbi:MAG: thioredoxin family protein [bacterium]